jgi:hypothetical protein
MKHINEDLLYKYALQLLDYKKEVDIREHLDNCDYCKNEFDNIEKRMNLIGSVDFKIDDSYSPAPQKTFIYSTWIKSAAVLMIGFLLGYSASNIVRNDRVAVVGQTVIPQTTINDTTQFVECPTVDIYSLN